MLKNMLEQAPHIERQTQSAQSLQPVPPKYDYAQPDAHGYFGEYGGAFVSETLATSLEKLTDAYAELANDAAFWQTYRQELIDFVGRPSPLYFAKNLSNHVHNIHNVTNETNETDETDESVAINSSSNTSHTQLGAQIYLKREDLNHTGAHKINNVIGQILMAKKMGKTRIIAETGAGQHGVASATICARYGLECVVYMGAKDVARQAVNVQRMQLLGATVVPVYAGSQTLKDALNEAMRDWVANVDDTFYMIGTVAGPHPYPAMVRDFQKVIGEESIEQFQALALDKQGFEQIQPNYVIACVGGGSNAIGIFYPYISHLECRLIGVEAAGAGMHTTQHACSLQKGRPGILHGNKTYIIQDEHGQILDTHSISAGLDYPGVGPEHAHLLDIGRAQYVGITDVEALEAFHLCARLEGIIPALETSHAIAYALKLAKTLPATQTILVNLSGRGDKDLHTVEHAQTHAS